jgi:hypothetical protein
MQTRFGHLESQQLAVCGMHVVATMLLLVAPGIQPWHRGKQR